MGIVDLARNLKLNKNGIWMSPGTINGVSYPVHGHSRNFQIEDNSFWFQHRNECILAAIKLFPPSGGILEIGGGNGYVARRILDEGFECALLEPGPIGALNAKQERNIPEVICSSVEAAQFELGKLSAVGMFDVIEHIKDDGAMVNELCDLLQPRGLFYCTIPMHQWLWSKHDVTAGHVRRYNRGSFEQLLSDRFELLYFSHFFSLLVIPMFLLKTLPFRLLGGRNILSHKVEHVTEGGMSGSLLRGLLNKEVGKIINGQQIRIGTSALVVARKI
jgi:SAM-dependent methyltransferase